MKLEQPTNIHLGLDPGIILKQAADVTSILLSSLVSQHNQPWRVLLSTANVSFLKEGENPSRTSSVYSGLTALDIIPYLSALFDSQRDFLLKTTAITVVMIKVDNIINDVNSGITVVEWISIMWVLCSYGRLNT